MKKLFVKAWWLLVTLAGGYLVFLEVGMALSEFHALRGANILFFMAFVAIGLFLFFSGFSRLRRRTEDRSQEQEYS